MRPVVHKLGPFEQGIKTVKIPIRSLSVNSERHRERAPFSANRANLERATWLRRRESIDEAVNLMAIRASENARVGDNSDEFDRWLAAFLA